MRTWITVVVLLTPPVSGAAQWSLAPDVGFTHFSAAGRDTSGMRIGPTPTTLIGVRFARVTSRYGYGIRVRTGGSGLKATDGDLTIVYESLLRLWEFGAFASAPVARIGSGTAIELEAGPTVTVWDPKGDPARTRVGAAAAAAWTLPVSRTMRAALRVEASYSGSVFNQADLPDGATRRGTWRRGVAFEVRRTF